MRFTNFTEALDPGRLVHALALPAEAVVARYADLAAVIPGVTLHVKIHIYIYLYILYI